MRMLPDVTALSAARSEEILRPVKPSFILLTLFIALLANIVPLAPAATALRPDLLALVLLVRIVGGAPLPRWTYAVPPVVGALLWPVLSVLLQYPQRPTHSSTKR